MVLSWSVAGVDLARWGIQNSSLWRPGISVRGQTIQSPGRHGVISAGLPVFEEPLLTFNLRHFGHYGHFDEGEIEAASMDLIGTLQSPGLIVSRTSGTLTTTAAGRLVSITPDLFVAGVVHAYNVIVGLPGVFLRTEPAVSDLGVVTSGVEREASHLAGTTAPVADAILRVRGPLSAAQVADVLTGTGLSWAGSLTGSQYLYLDAGTLTARRSTSASAWLSGGTDVSGQLSYPAEGPLQAWPRMQGTDPTDRRISLRITGSGFGGTTAVAVRAGGSYL